jgi:hypothetical protein
MVAPSAMLPCRWLCGSRLSDRAPGGVSIAALPAVWLDAATRACDPDPEAFRTVRAGSAWRTVDMDPLVFGAVRAFAFTAVGEPVGVGGVPAEIGEMGREGCCWVASPGIWPASELGISTEVVALRSTSVKIARSVWLPDRRPNERSNRWCEDLIPGEPDRGGDGAGRREFDAIRVPRLPGVPEFPVRVDPPAGALRALVRRRPARVGESGRD